MNVEETRERHVTYISEDWLDAPLAGYTKPGWYFWDEAAARCYGPHPGRSDAEEAMGRHCEGLNRPKEEQ